MIVANRHHANKNNPSNYNDRALVLPFVDKKEFSKAMEIASILCDIEWNREKGGGFLVKKSHERIVFIVKILWPLWLVSLENSRAFIFDALNLLSHSYEYDLIPDSSNFIQEISNYLEVNEELSSAYLSVLKKYQYTFDNFASKQHGTFRGMLPDEDIVSDLSVYLQDLTVADISDAVIISPNIDFREAKIEAERLLDLKKKVKSDIEMLKNPKNSVALNSEKWVNAIMARETNVSEKYDSEIEEIRPEVEDAIADYEEEMEKEIRQVSAPFEAQLSSLRDYETERAEKIEDAMNDKISEVEEHYKALIDEEREKIKVLEKERDSEIKTLEHQRKEIEDTTERITGKIQKLIDKKYNFIDSIDRLKVSLPAKFDEAHCVYMPRYLARYESESGVRYRIYPLMTVKSGKGFGVIKQMFGGLIIPLEPRKRIENTMKKPFEQAIQKNEKIAKEIQTGGREKNILKNQVFRDLFYDGVEKLGQEGWIKDKQVNYFKDVFKQHFSIAS